MEIIQDKYCLHNIITYNSFKNLYHGLGIVNKCKKCEKNDLIYDSDI